MFSAKYLLTKLCEWFQLCKGNCFGLFNNSVRNVQLGDNSWGQFYEKVLFSINASLPFMYFLPCQIAGLAFFQTLFFLYFYMVLGLWNFIFEVHSSKTASFCCIECKYECVCCVNLCVLSYHRTRRWCHTLEKNVSQEIYVCLLSFSIFPLKAMDKECATDLLLYVFMHVFMLRI